MKLPEFKPVYSFDCPPFPLASWFLSLGTGTSPMQVTWKNWSDFFLKPVCTWSLISISDWCHWGAIMPALRPAFLSMCYTIRSTAVREHSKLESPSTIPFPSFPSPRLLSSSPFNPSMKLWIQKLLMDMNPWKGFHPCGWNKHKYESALRDNEECESGNKDRSWQYSGNLSTWKLVLVIRGTSHGGEGGMSIVKTESDPCSSNSHLYY